MTARGDGGPARGAKGLRAAIRAALAEHATPRALAAAMVVGAICGCTPFFGFHLLLCLGVAWLLRLNFVAVYAAANVTIPPLAPLIGFASVELGERLRRGRFLALTLDEFRHADGGVAPLARRFFADWLLGGAFVGAAIGGVLAAFVYVGARRATRRVAEETPEARAVTTAIGEATARFAFAPPRLRHYAKWKYRLDPCYRRIAELVPPGADAVDLGSGLGMLPLVLALLPGGRRVVGIEWDEAKHAAGVAAARGVPHVTLVRGDARSHDLPPCDVVTLVDVLHYFEAGEQRALLRRAAAALRPGGQLLVREGDARREGGARLTRALEAMAVRIGWNRADRTRFRSVAELRTDLAALGLAVDVEPLAGRLHPGNVLLRARRPADPGPAAHDADA